MAKGWKKEVGAIVHSRGVTFRVWAPFADSVQVKFGSYSVENWKFVDLENEGDGYWSVQEKNAEAGQEYKFIIKNADDTFERNDPRAMQLTSTNGTSVIVDPHFDWGKDRMKLPQKREMVVYEMHVGTFLRPDASSEGTFYDAIDKLDHLAELGVNVIELMPIGSMRNDHGWGYTSEYIFAVESAYGGRHALLEFVKAAHTRGIGVTLDVVYNHIGPDTNMDLWRFDGWYEDNGGGIYFYNDWRGKTPWGHTRPDYGRAEVQQWILDNVRYWIHDCHLDGIRVDSTLFFRNVHGHYNDLGSNLPEAWTLLQDINSLIHKIRSDAISIAEDIAGNEYITKPTNESGAGFDSQWQVTMPHAFRQALLPNKREDITLTEIVSEIMRTYNADYSQRIVFFDSHDSAANGGARLNEQVDPGHAQSTKALSKLLLATGIQMTIPGIPMMLMGQEFAQGGSFDDWRMLDWGLSEKYSGILEAHKHLISLRKNSHANSQGLLGQGISISHVDEDNKVIAYHRWDKGGPKDDVVVIANFAKRTHKEYVLGWPRNGTWRVRFNSSWKGYHEGFKGIDVPDVTVDSGSGSVVLPPTSLLILSQDE